MCRGVLLPVFELALRSSCPSPGPEAGQTVLGQQTVSQSQMPMPQPYMQMPAMYTPSSPAAPSKEVLDFISSMTTRIEALETRSDTFTERLLAMKEEQYQQALANVTTAASAKMPSPPPETTSVQLAAVQERLHTMYSTGLLPDACFFELEDRIADHIFLSSSVGGQETDSAAQLPHELYVSAERMHQLVGLSEAMSRDQSFARQLVRKFCVASPGASASGEHFTSWQTPGVHKSGAGVQISYGVQRKGTEGRDEKGSGADTSSGGAATIESWLDSYELSEYTDGVKGAGYNSMRFLKAATKEDLEEMATDVGMKKVHMKVFLAAWDELLQVQLQPQ